MAWAPWTRLAQFGSQLYSVYAAMRSVASVTLPMTQSLEIPAHMHSITPIYLFLNQLECFILLKYNIGQYRDERREFTRHTPCKKCFLVFSRPKLLIIAYQEWHPHHTGARRATGELHQASRSHSSQDVHLTGIEPLPSLVQRNSKESQPTCHHPG